jgi:AAA domain
VTRGGLWPDGGFAPAGDVIVLSAEDNAADTIRPRADGLGADVTRIHVLSAIRVEGASAADQDQPFSLVTDLLCLEAAIVETGAILVNIDPVSAYLGLKIDSYKDAHVRSVFGPLAALAERLNVAIVGVMHLSKGTDRRALYRALGSVAFVAAARLVLAVAPHPEDDDARVLVPVKSNICAPATTLAYRLTDGRLTWDADPVVNVTADQLLSGPALDRQEHREADEWLREALADGPTLSKDIEAAAEQVGIARRTLFRAKARLRVDAERIGGATRGSGKWYWTLPAVKSASTPLELIKGASVGEVAPLIPNPANTADFTGLAIKSATLPTLAPLIDAAPLTTTGDDDLPAFLRDLVEPDFSDPIGSHDEEPEPSRQREDL